MAYRIEKPTLISCVVALVAGLLTHMFALTNVLQNYDNITASFQGFGNGVDSGRWALTFISIVMHKLFGGYNLPWFNGIVTILLLACSAGLSVSTLRLKKKITAALVGVCIVVFPTASSLLFFRFVSMYDALAVLLTIASVWVINRTRIAPIFSALCIAVSLGIYQAYFPITVCLVLILLLKDTINGTKCDIVFLNAMKYCAYLLIGLASYFVAQKATMLYFGAELSDYQGISNMAKLNLMERIEGIIRAYTLFLKMPVVDYCSVAPNLLSRLIIGGLYLLTISGILVILFVRKGKFAQYAVSLVLLIVYPCAVNLIEVMVPEGNIYTMMVYACVFIYITPLIIADEMFDIIDAQKVKRNVVVLAEIISIFVAMASVNYMYLDNVNYMAMYYKTKQTENYMNALVVQVRMTSGYKTSQKWVFIGDDFEDPLINEEWGEVPHYGGNGSNYINAYSRMRWINTYFGYDITLADDVLVENLAESDEVRNMPCFPNEGSIKIIDDMVVIKLEEDQNY